MVTGSSGSNRSRRSSPAPEVAVLRVGHRPGRDPRLTTHVALAARALGAQRLYLHPPDPVLVDRIQALVHRWGGTFEVEPTEDWKSLVRSFDGPVVHLTMYGLPLARVVPRLGKAKRILLVVGGAKVPSDLYRLSSFNAAVGAQPHSEVAAVAVALVQLLGLPSSRAARGARIAILPRARGKRLRARRAGR